MASKLTIGKVTVEKALVDSIEVVTTKPPKGYTVSVSQDAGWMSRGEELRVKYVLADGTGGIEELIQGSRISNVKSAIIYSSGSDSFATINGVMYSGVYDSGIGGYVLISYSEMDSDAVITSFYVNECLLEGTKILMSDGSLKNIEDISYDDTIRTWNFDEGRSENVHPLIIKKPDIIGNIYHRATFQSGRTLDVVSGHRVFSAKENRFKYASECVGEEVIDMNGNLDKILSYDTMTVDKNNMPRFYNVITERNFNLYANGLLTSCRLSNMYPVSDMRFDKSAPSTQIPYSEFDGILDEDMFNKLRISEQKYSVENLKTYFRRLMFNMLPV